ncbi:hypothetical protein HZS_2730 [Henneguya salminicola]|nr:hypothetical protein HZS_2730 [Henneguya salminicola]
MKHAWNISELEEEDLEITNRTNNGLENFNKKINSLFPARHPNLFIFIRVINELSEEYCRLSTVIISGECNRPKRTVYNEISYDLKTKLN